MGLVHKVEMGNTDGLREWVSAGIHGNRFKKLDGWERERVEEVGASVLMGSSWEPVKALTHVHVCKA